MYKAINLPHYDKKKTPQIHIAILVIDEKVEYSR